MSTAHTAKRGRPRKSPELLLRTVNLRLPQGLMEDIEEIRDRRPPETDLADVLRELLRTGVEVENSKKQRATR